MLNWAEHEKRFITSGPGDTFKTDLWRGLANTDVDHNNNVSVG